MATIYKICAQPEWRAAEREGLYRGSEIDMRDGFIHFSTAAQTIETAEKHFAGQRDLMLVAVDAAALGCGAEMGTVARRRFVSALLRRDAVVGGALGEAAAG